jgi:hypothetical protein
MKKFFTLLTMCLLFSVAWADAVITFIPGETVGTQETVSTSDMMEKDGITISTTYGAFKAAQYRFGMNAVTTITSSIGNITKIEFTGASSQNPISGFGDNEGMSYQDNDGEWNGDAAEITLTTKVKQARASKIVVYVGGSGLSAPRFNPAGGTYFEPIQVSISCSTSGAKIYYTTNGVDPTTSSQQYSAPISVNTNTTIKAISALNGETSAVATAQYVFSDRIGLGGLAGIEDNTEVALGYDATVLHQAGNTMYVKDQTGFGLIYGSTGKTYKKGDVIPAGYGGLKVTYNAEPEVKNPVGFNAPSGTVTVNAEQITCSQVNHDRWAHYVVIKNATINMTDDNNGTLTDASGSCPIYNKTFGATLPSDGQPHTVYAIVASFQPGGQGEVTYQLLPIEVEGVGPGPDPEMIEVGLGQLATVADNKEVKLVYDAVVIWQGGNNNKYLYAKDETGFGLIYGPTGQTYTIGDIIPKNYTGKKTTYKGEPELADPAGMQASAGNNGITPETMTCSMVNHDNWAHYVLIKNAKLSADGKTLTDASGSCEFYNGTFNITLPTDGAAHDWYGIVGVFSNYQFLPLSVDVAPGPPAPVLPTDVENINELYQLPEGSEGHFVTPLTAIYQNGLRLYVQDVEGTQTLVYGSVPGEFVNGDIINDAIAKWSVYQEAKQMIPVDNFVVAGKGAKVSPDDPMPIEEISQDLIHRYLSFEDVTIIEEDGKYYMVDATGRIQLFDQFKIGVDKYVDGETHYVEGFLTIFRGELELYPTLIDGDDECGKKGDVNGDGEIGIADINALIDIILGADVDECTKWRADVNNDNETGIADINALINLILGV